MSSFVSVLVFNQLHIECRAIDRDNTTPDVDIVNLVCSFILGLSCYPANIYFVCQSSLFNIIGFPEIDVMQIETIGRGSMIVFQVPKNLLALPSKLFS